MPPRFHVTIVKLTGTTIVGIAALLANPSQATASPSKNTTDTDICRKNSWPQL
jgi:hypothetical protein